MTLAKLAIRIAIVGLTLAAHTSTVRASITSYSWSGTCVDAPPPAGCGTGTAHALLQLQDYTPGAQLQLGNLLHFSYASALYNAGYSSQFGFATVGGFLPAVPFGTPFAADLTILIWDNPTHTSVSMFETFSSFNGFWCFNACGHDVGNGSTFVQVENVAVPEPHILAVLCLGAAGLGLTRRRIFASGARSRREEH